LCFEGPLEELTKTDIAQPAIYVCSLAALAALNESLAQSIKPQLCAGLSLGEYSAMAAAGAISFANGLKLVRLRGAAMQEASELKPSSMTSVLGLNREQLQEICQQVETQTKQICQVANVNSPGQIVVSGEIAALDVFEPLATEAGARRAIRLNVAGAFHSEVMRPAAVKLEAALANTDFAAPSCPIWQNATARSETEPANLRANLVAQLCAPVLWQDSFCAMSKDLENFQFIELAPGKVLTGLARKINRDAAVTPIPTHQQIAEVHALA